MGATNLFGASAELLARGVYRITFDSSAIFEAPPSVTISPHTSTVDGNPGKDDKLVVLIDFVTTTEAEVIVGYFGGLNNGISTFTVPVGFDFVIAGPPKQKNPTVVCV
mmetsp:Transcript_33165/g.97863  ORF Transcript_33165/g.97863 Transcript_33165/m.97863 type:complete len:108 (+) Transcript_33165:659-982(+)